MSLRGRRAAVAIFKPKAWHPVARQESTRREEIPITEAAKRAIPHSPLSPPDFQIPVRSVSSCLVPGRRLVPSKIAASGVRALLAMTKLIGLLENGAIFGTKRFKSVPAGHRKNSAGLSAGRKKKAKEKSQCERIHTGFWCARRDLNPHVRSGH